MRYQGELLGRSDNPLFKSEISMDVRGETEGGPVSCKGTGT